MEKQEIKAEERNAIFGEIILGYAIFEKTSLKTNGSHWKSYLWRKASLKAVLLHSIKTRARLHGIQVMMPYVREAPVADVVLAAGLKIQPPPLRGGGAVDNNQGDGSHDHQMQAFSPSAPARAVATVMITFRISVQVFFFVLELIGFLF